MKELEITRAKMAMLRAGLTTADLAHRTGLSIYTTRSVLNGAVTCLRTRRRVEQVLGTIWTNGRDLLTARLLSATLGSDPALTNLDILRSKASKMRIRGRSQFRGKCELINALAAALNESRRTGGTKKRK